MTCTICNGMGCVDNARGFMVRESGSWVSDFDHTPIPCKCELGGGWARRDHACMWRFAHTLNSFIDSVYNMKDSVMPRRCKKARLRETIKRFDAGERECGLGIFDGTETWGTRKRKREVVV